MIKQPQPVSSEYRAKARAKRQRIQDIVLRSLLLAGTLGIAIAAPNSAKLLRYVQKYIDRKDANLDRRISQALSRLKEKGIVNRNEKGGFALTKKGEKIAATLETLDLTERPLIWDGRWRIVIFDIWERRRSARDRLRTILKRNGFAKIQNSVWVYPYDCEELFAFLRTHLSLGRGIVYIIASEIENDMHLRRYFRLRS
jgi:DNA-binding transcriptional ArsR family regulator